jgi:hypothetical protein
VTNRSLSSDNVRRAFREELGPGQRSALISWLAFTGTFALLLDLKDVYWAKQGRISIDLGVGGIALAGSYFAALPVLRRLRR